MIEMFSPDPNNKNHLQWNHNVDKTFYGLQQLPALFRKLFDVWKPIDIFPETSATLIIKYFFASIVKLFCNSMQPERERRSRSRFR